MQPKRHLDHGEAVTDAQLYISNCSFENTFSRIQVRVFSFIFLEKKPQGWKVAFWVCYKFYFSASKPTAYCRNIRGNPFCS